MRNSPIAGFVSQLANKYEIPGVAVGVWTKGKAYLACHGITDSRPIETDRTGHPVPRRLGHQDLHRHLHRT